MTTRGFRLVAAEAREASRRAPESRPDRGEAGAGVGGVGGEALLVARLEKDGAVALLLESQGEVPAAGLEDAAAGQDVDDVRLDVVQQALVVGDDEHAEVRG